MEQVITCYNVPTDKQVPESKIVCYQNTFCCMSVLVLFD